MTVYRGKVSGYTPRTESGVFRRRQTLIWDFRLERHQDDGQPLPRLAVQLRAKYYRGGAVNNGDVVEVSGHPDRNGVVIVREVTNLTSGTTIRARNWNLSVVLVYLVPLLIVGAVIACVSAFLLDGDTQISFNP